MTDRVDRLRREYLKLGLGESAAVVAIIFATLASALPRLHGTERLALWSAVVPLVVVLVQAAAFWLSARPRLPSTPMPASLATVYRVFRVGNIAVLTAGLVGLVTWWPHRGWVSVLVVAVWLFAVVEYVNYYVVRLSYPLPRWLTEIRRWRTPRLIKDITAADSVRSTSRPVREAPRRRHRP